MFEGVLILTFAFFNFLSVNAIEVNALQKCISYEDVLQKAKLRSYDLKLTDYEVMIAKTGITSARSDYFPKLNAMAGTEYTKSFRDYGNSVITTIGDTFINPYTRFQSVMGITLSYNIFDFGIRRGKLDMAKEDIILKELKEKEAFQELQLNLIDIYTKILSASKQVLLYEEILVLEQENLELMARLSDAKLVSRMDLNNQEVKVNQVRKHLEELKQILSENLTWLTFYTGEDYDIENIKVENIKKVNFNPLEYSDYTQSLTWKIYESELKKKELELNVVKKTNYPKINAYGRYYIYGADHSSYRESLSDVSPSNFTVGGNVYMPVFDGLKNHADIKKDPIKESFLIWAAVD